MNLFHTLFLNDTGLASTAGAAGVCAGAKTQIYGEIPKSRNRFIDAWFFLMAVVGALRSDMA